MDATTLRLSLFLGLFLLFALAESLWPRRRLQQGYRRWPANLGLVVIDALLVRLLLPAGALGAALWAQTAGFGLLHLIVLPGWLEVLLAVIALDAVIYWQHRMFHGVPLLWRLHRVHHADREIDLSTGLRFHPFEILLSMLIKMAVVSLLGADVLAVVIFEVLLNGMAMFNHANIHLPHRLDALLRLLLVTPDVHRVHHSTIPAELNSNFGFNLSLWDRLFGSWREAPALGHKGMQIGLAELQSAPTARLGFMLYLPFSDSQNPLSTQQRGDGHE